MATAKGNVSRMHTRVPNKMHRHRPALLCMMFAALAASLILAGAPAGAQQPPPDVHRLDACVSDTAPVEAPCALPVRFSPGAAQALLARRDSMWWLIGDRLTLIARPGEEGWSKLCCAIQTPLEPIDGSGLAGITVRVPRIREALIDVTDSNAQMLQPPDVIRGPDAPPAPPIAHPLAGRLIPFTFDSAALGETRQGTIYLPADVPKGVQLPSIYLADGATWQFAPILEAAVRDGRAAPAIIVGIDSADGFVPNCGKSVCDRRNLDYIAYQAHGDAEPDPQFSRHLRFVADELVPWIEANYPASPRREDRVAAGFSSGAAWAFAAAALRPELFGKVLGMSSGSRATIPYAGRLGSARIYTGAGLFEPYFLVPTRERARLARAAGADVRFRELVAGHSMAMWDILFADGVAWLLPPDQ